jgi:hypothetical protein
MGFRCGAKTTNVMIGTILWEWPDNTGKIHRFQIPKSYYIPHGKCQLLSPQHWAQTQSNKSSEGAAGETTTATTSTLFWKEGAHKLTIPLSKYTNVATFSTAPGFNNFNHYCHKVKIDRDEENILYAQDAGIVSDDKEDAIPSNKEPSHPPIDEDRPWSEATAPQLFEIHNISQPDKTSDLTKDDKDSTLLLKIHQRMNHTSFAKLKEMAKKGIIPQRLAKCATPLCSSCSYAKITKKRRHNKPKSIQYPNRLMDPGGVVSIDQMVSPTHGFIAQMTGKLTTVRYKYATIYVDQASRLGYVHLQKSATAEETLKGKLAFELFAKGHNITIKAYHADNSVFRANAWVNNCNMLNQRMTYAGVNAHHQNGVAKRRIQELQELTRAALIHANKRWPQCITANLWPYALRMANLTYNHSSSMQNEHKYAPIQVFSSKTKVEVNLKHFHPFGCPVYVLASALQMSTPYHKWKERSKIGIYLGQSPLHGKNVALVLDRTTGLVSPQFHVLFDDQFDTTKQEPALTSAWQDKAGFLLKPEKVDSSKTKKSNRATKRNRPTPDPTALPTNIPTSEGVRNTSVPEGEKANAQDKEQNHPTPTEGDKRTLAPQMDQPDLVIPGTLQHKSGDSSSTQLRKKLKPQNIGQVTNDLKTQTGSGLEATTPGPTLQPKSGQVQPPPALIEAMMTEIVENTHQDIQGEIFCLESMFPDNNNINEDNDLLYAYKALADPDTMYHHQAMMEPDTKDFKEAMAKEIADQMQNSNFTLHKKVDVPKDKTILPAVWQMRRKRDIKTGKIKKWKA